MPPPAAPKLYHIVHVDRLESIIEDGFLWCDAELQRQVRPGTTIGMSSIKQRRLTTPVKCQPGLKVGDCVPFYFCPRSVMLYLLHKANHSELDYRGGQGSIMHLEADLYEVVAWADRHNRRWAFTLSNAAALYTEDRCDLGQLDEIDWAAVSAQNWSSCKEGKQAEFLVERSFPWTLVRRVGVFSARARKRFTEVTRIAGHRPDVAVRPDWYY